MTFFIFFSEYEYIVENGRENIVNIFCTLITLTYLRAVIRHYIAYDI